MDTNFNFNEILNATKQSLGLSDKIIFKLYNSALEVSEEVTDEIEKGIQDSDYLKIKNAAHKLKSASGSIRLDPMYELSLKLENDAKEQKYKDYSI
jgi:HPt (histidine-containing phosphotransfer) domain-containing protein